MKSLTTFAFCVAFYCGTAVAQQQREKPQELEALGQYVGDWTSDVTSKPAEWTPKQIEFQTANHAEWILNGWFLQHIEVNQIVGEPKAIGKSLFVWTFDPDSKKYVGWSFQSSGNISKVTGTWNSVNKTFNHIDANPPPNMTVRLTEKFESDSSIYGTLLFTRNDGVKMFDMVWTRSRQKGPASNPLLAQWAKIGTPIQPIPDQVKKLEPFTGPKNVEFIHRPSVVSPRGGTTRTVSSGEWILDGRFVLARSGTGTRESLFISGYDSNKHAFRYVRLGFNGELEENIGHWNEATRSFEWKGVDEATGLIRTSTSRLIGNGEIETHIVSMTQNGKVHMDLTIKSTPRN